MAHNKYLGHVGCGLTLGAEPSTLHLNTIFKETKEDYAIQLTTTALSGVSCIVAPTSIEGIFISCIVGQL